MEVYQEYLICSTFTSGKYKQRTLRIGGGGKRKGPALTVA